MRIIDFISINELLEAGFRQTDSTEFVFNKSVGDKQIVFILDIINDDSNYKHNSTYYLYNKNSTVINKRLKINNKKELFNFMDINDNR